MILGRAWELGRCSSSARCKPAFAAQIDVDQRDIRAQFFHPLDCLSDRRGSTDDRDAATLEQSRGYFNKHGVVIDDYAAQLLYSRRHSSSFAYESGGAHTG